VDKDDVVRYYSQGRGRIFARTKAVVGRKVQQCRPQKSIHIVNRILEAFKDGSRDVAEFWINFRGKLIYIRYFAVRERDKKYLGRLEVTQDITNIKKIEGKKNDRLDINQIQQLSDVEVESKMKRACPGLEDLLRPKPEYIDCPRCGSEVEIWTDEKEAKCTNCGMVVARDRASCLDWCKYAEKCREIIAKKKET
jgi:hypothetical protein